MPGHGSTTTLGRVIIDSSGRKPPRVGLKTDGFDMLDTVEQVKQATMASVQKQSDSIERNKTVVIPAVSALQAQVQTFHDEAVALSNYLGASPSIPNVFRDLECSIVKSGEYSQASYASVTVDPTVAQATTNDIALRIRQLAIVDSRISSIATILKSDGMTPIADADDPLGLAGVFTINGGANITIAAGDSLRAIVSAINHSNSRVQARYVQNGTNYNLILNGTELATALTFGGTNPNYLQTYFGIDVTTPTDLTRLQARVEHDVVDGATGTVTKTYRFNTNEVTNLIPGVTIKLLNTTLSSGGTYDNLNISVRENTQVVYDRVVSFFKQYCDIHEILNRNLLVDDEGAPLDPKAAMLRSPLVRQLREQLDTIVTMTLAGAEDDDYLTWQNIGITRDELATGFQDGNFAIDATKLWAAVSNNFEKVRKLFGNYTTVTDEDFRVWDIGRTLDDSIAGEDITITFRRAGDSYYARFVCGAEDTGDVEQTNGYLFLGPEDSVFTGIQIGYTGIPLEDGDSKTFTLTATQGLADRIAKRFEGILDKDSGAFSGETKRIKQENERLKSQVERAEKKAEQFERKSLAQAARLNAMQMQYQQLSEQLKSLFGGDNK